MAALTERKIKIVRSLVENAPDRVVGSLRQALADTADESALGGVRRLVEFEVLDRTLRNTILGPVAPMFVGAGDNPRVLTFPARALSLLWRALRQAESDAIEKARADAMEAGSGHVLMANHDHLVAIAAEGLRVRSSPDYQATAEICDRARPNGAGLLSDCLAIAPVVRRASQKLPEWIAHPGGDTAAAARLAYKDAVEIDDAAGYRFFEMLAAQLAQPWMVLRVISAVMDKPTERYLADSELAGFGAAVLDEIDASLALIAGLDPEAGPMRGSSAAKLADLVVHQLVEVESSVDLQKDHGWGQRVHKQKVSLAGVVEGRLREAEKAVLDALPLHSPRQQRGNRQVPRLGVPPEQRLVTRARTLLTFNDELRSTANYGGFGAARGRLLEKLGEFLERYVDEVVDMIRNHEAEDRTLAAEFLEIAAEFSQLVSGDKAGDLVRRRAHAVLHPDSHVEGQG